MAKNKNPYKQVKKVDTAIDELITNGYNITTEERGKVNRIPSKKEAAFLRRIGEQLKGIGFK